MITFLLVIHGLITLALVAVILLQRSEGGALGIGGGGGGGLMTARGAANLLTRATTILAALILFQLGSGPVRGFAVTLGLGIIISFFSAVMVTRVMIVLWMRRAKPKSINL